MGAEFNENRKKRESYLSEDGKSYYYRKWNPETGCEEYEVLRAGENDVTRQWLKLLDSMDRETYKQNRKEMSYRDRLFYDDLCRYESGLQDRKGNPWNEIPDNRADPFINIDADVEAVSDDVELICRVIEEEFTEEQKKLYYKRFVEARSFKEIMDAEMAEKGKRPSRQAVDCRLKKINKKVRNAFENRKPKYEKGTTSGN